jgi:archaetidylinositol phosphate synthase
MSTLTEVRERPQGSHVRVHGSVLAEGEKRLLVWLARRLPLRMNADHLTAIGVFGTAAAGAAFAAASWDRRALWLVPVMLAVNWFGDSLDGTVARVRGHQRPRYGYYLDHAVDLLNATALFTGMAFSGLMEPRLGLALLLGYVLLCAESFLATHAVGVFRISFSGVGPTELRILLSIGAIVAIWRPIVTPFGLPPVALFDISAVISLVGMAIAFGVSMWRNARTLYLAEPLPPRRSLAAVRPKGGQSNTVSSRGAATCSSVRGGAS